MTIVTLHCLMNLTLHVKSFNQFDYDRAKFIWAKRLKRIL